MPEKKKQGREVYTYGAYYVDTKGQRQYFNKPFTSHVPPRKAQEALDNGGERFRRIYLEVRSIGRV